MEKNIREFEGLTNLLEAKNTIKYTLLLDYKCPELDKVEKYINQKDKNIVVSVLDECASCCRELFADNNKSYRENLSYNFFGLKDFFLTNSELNEVNILPKIAKNTNETTGESERIRSNADDFFRKPYLQNLILQHCLVKSYHVIETAIMERDNEAITTDNAIAKASHLHYESIKVRTNDSYGSDFKKGREGRENIIPFLSKISKKTMFKELTYIVERASKKSFKSLYQSDEPQKKSRSEYICAIDTLSKQLYPLYNSDNKKSPFKYLMELYYAESVFNLSLFKSIIRFIKEVTCDKKINYNLDQKDFIDVFCSLKKLPNVFSRQIMISYAFQCIHSQTISSHDFWNEHDLEKTDIMVTTIRKSNIHFDLYAWKNQMILFCDYMSQFIIPVYEWCFMNMLFDVLKKEFPEKSSSELLDKARDILKIFITDNLESIIKPVNLKKGILSYTTSISSVNKYTLSSMQDSIDNDFLDEFKKKFFEGDTLVNFDMSPNIGRSYFKFPMNNGNDTSLIRIRNFYIDLLKYK